MNETTIGTAVLLFIAIADHVDMDGPFFIRRATGVIMGRSFIRTGPPLSYFKVDNSILNNFIQA
jgi:hypothetical protein